MSSVPRFPRAVRAVLFASMALMPLLIAVSARAQGAADSTSLRSEDAQAPPPAAQQPSPPAMITPPPPIPTVEEANPSLGLIPLRPQSEISATITAAKANVAAIDAALTPVRDRAVIAKGKQNIMKLQLETSESRLKLAKKAKNEDVTTLKATVEREKRELAYLQRTADAMNADVERVEAEREAAKATVTLYERELELAMLRTSPSVTGADPRFPSMVQRMLEALKTTAIKRGEAAARARGVADHQLGQLKTLNKMAK